ncbi:MAG: hypothetical protein PHV34_09905 [Verrucomicrobiae bacterium]|nr:hypothetical protein [Verrucomicrobiae bacterium]
MLSNDFEFLMQRRKCRKRVLKKYKKMLALENDIRIKDQLFIGDFDPSRKRKLANEKSKNCMVDGSLRPVMDGPDCGECGKTGIFATGNIGGWRLFGAPS